MFGQTWESIVGWMVSGAVHAAAAGALWGTANYFGQVYIQVQPGDAITLVGRQAMRETEEIWTAVIVKDNENPNQSRANSFKEPEPQKIEIERRQPDVKPPIPIVEVGELRQTPPATHDFERAHEREMATALADREAPLEDRRTTKRREVAKALQASVAQDAVRPAVAGANTLPRKMPNNVSPVYPPDALSGGRQGRVILKVLVSAEGRVTRADIETTSGTPSLDAAALVAVRQWRFEPARRDSVPVEGALLVPVNFRIE